MRLFGKTKAVGNVEAIEIAQNINSLSAKNLALDIVVSYVANIFSKTKFKFNGNDAVNRLYYFNRSPNVNQSAQEFWKTVAYELISKGEALVLPLNKQFFLADSFYREEKITGDIFKNITISEWMSPTDYKREDVLYFRYKNKSLESFTSTLWEEYGNILGKLVTDQKKANQVRATFEMPNKNEIEDKEFQEKTKKFVGKIIEQIRKDPVVIIPTSQSTKYDEQGTGGSTKSSNSSYVTDIEKMKDMFINDISDLIGVPRDLIFGGKADNEKNYNLFVETVIEHLQGIVVSELNHSLSPVEFKNGLKYSTKSVRYRDIFSLSTSIDKLVSSATFNRDEVREELGFDSIPGGSEFLITKNYMKYGEEEKK